MKTKPETTKGSSVTQAIRVTINGQTFELSKADAAKLRDQLDEAVGAEKETHWIPYPVPAPYPVLLAPLPRWDLPYVTTTGTQADTYARGFEITCHS